MGSGAQRRFGPTSVPDDQSRAASQNSSPGPGRAWVSFRGFDDAEDGGGVSAALVFSRGLARSGQCGPQCAQVSEGVVDVADALLKQCGDPVAGSGAVALQIQELFDFLQGEPESFSVPDEAQDLDVMVGEQAVAGRGALGRRQQAIGSHSRMAFGLTPTVSAASPTVCSMVILLRRVWPPFLTFTLGKGLASRRLGKTAGDRRGKWDVGRNLLGDRAGGLEGDASPDFQGVVGESFAIAAQQCDVDGSGDGIGSLMVHEDREQVPV